MEYLAHTANTAGVTHKLHEHLQAVGTLAANFADEIDPALAETARWAGLLHDLGKYRDDFQEYLLGKRQRDTNTHHAVYGAALAARLKCLALSYAVAGHHAGLHDVGQLQDLVKRECYQLDQRLPEIRSLFEREVGQIPQRISEPAFVGNNSRTELYVRMIFSALVDADFLDTEAHYAAASDLRPARLLRASELLEGLTAAKEEKSRAARAQAESGELSRLRDEVYEQCLKAGERPQGFFSLTVPTGGGKTIAGMSFALAHAARHHLRRIIVVIPYLSIIEQNAAEYRRILDPEREGVIIEDHSAVIVPQTENQPNGGSNEKRARSPLELAAENWDAPVVVTTAIQFIESLFSNRPSRCRKLHNIARSVALLDEVQTLPAHLLNPLLGMMRELRDSYGVSFVFSTATQPAFQRHHSLPNGFTEDEIKQMEIVENPRELFQQLRRVRFELPQGEERMSWGEIADGMKEAPQSLCVVNLRRHAFALWEVLRAELSDEEAESVFHLTSAMCAEHRLHVIGEMHAPREGSIRWRLQKGWPCRVVSTQLVEAGVDLDFPLVYRALGPLDSIVQAAGRCNREGHLRDSAGRPALGRVIVFRPQDEGLPGDIYRTATQIAASMLGNLVDEELATNHGLFAKYFKRLYQQTETDHARRGESTIEEDRKNLDFRKIAGKARVIQNEGVSVIVQYGNSPNIIDDLRNRRHSKDMPRFTRDDLRGLQRYMVNLWPKDFAQLNRTGQLQPLLPNSKLELYVLNEGSYDDHLGVIIGSRSAGDYIL